MNKTGIDASIKVMYQTEKRSIYSIGTSLGIHPRTVHQHLIKMGIPRRKAGVSHWSEEQKQHKREWNLAHPEIMRHIGFKLSEETKKLMSIQRTGPGNANWKGGVTEGVRLFRKSRRYQQWRRSVLARDNHTCSVCGNPAVVAHHIKPVKQFPELRFVVENGISMCVKDHNSLHKTKKVINH